MFGSMFQNKRHEKATLLSEDKHTAWQEKLLMDPSERVHYGYDTKITINWC